MSDNSNIDPHSALTSLWPSDTEESKKLAEEKQIKRQNLTDLGNQFKQAREALGYNISDLDEHTGLSFTELEALEQGLFQHIEQQDYVDYYVHTYAALLSLDADEILANFKQNYYQTEAASDDEAQNTNDIDIHDESQYEDAFAEEARKTLEALDASDVNALQAANQLEIEQDAAQGIHTELAGEPETTDSQPVDTAQTEPTEPATTSETSEPHSLQADANHEPITSNHNLQQSKPFPWLKLVASFGIVLLVAGAAYYANLKFGSGQTSDPANENAASLTNNSVSIVKDGERVPEGQKAKKIGVLESKIITQGSNDLNAPTAEMIQKPLVLIGETASDINDEIIEQAQDIVKQASDNIGDIISDAGNDSAAKDAVETATEKVTEVAKVINEDLAKASELAKAAEATKTATEAAAAELAQKTVAEKPAETEADNGQLPEDPIKEALAQLPSDNSKYSLHATANSWVLIEDDAAQILFSGELTPEKIVTLPKITGVIISLGDAGVIEVYKGKQLLGKLGAKDETLDLVSVEQRFNQISN